MEDAMQFVKEHVLPYWPWAVGALGFWFIGKFMKAQVWTKERALKPGKGRAFFHFMRRTMAMHAPAAGILVGLVPGVPVSPGVDTVFAAVIYWFSAGVAASFGVHVASQWVKKKYGIDIDAAAEAAVSPSMSPLRPPPIPSSEDDTPVIGPSSKKPK